MFWSKLFELAYLWTIAYNIYLTMHKLYIRHCFGLRI
jgi:hypothetical protein